MPNYQIQNSAASKESSFVFRLDCLIVPMFSRCVQIFTQSYNEHIFE